MERNINKILIGFCILGIAISVIEGVGAVSGGGLVAYWSFDEGSGNTLHDLSGNENHGTIYGAVWTGGKSGNALYFDGDDDYVEIPADNIWM